MNIPVYCLLLLFFLHGFSSAITREEHDSLSSLIDSLEEVREEHVYSLQSLGVKIFGEARPYMMYHFGGGQARYAEFANGDRMPTLWMNEFTAVNGQSTGQFGYATMRGPGRLDFCQEANEPFLRLKIHARPLRNLKIRASLSITNRILGAESFLSGNGHWFHNFTQLQLFEELSSEAKIAFPFIGRIKTTMGGVLWQDYSPFTLWDKKVKLFSFFKSPWEGNFSQLDIYRGNMLKGEDYGKYTWVKRGIKGIMFKSLEMPANLDFSAHFGIVNSPWSEKYVKNRVFSSEEESFYEQPYVDRDLLDTIAAKQRFNDDWSAAAHISGRWNRFTQPLGFTWFNGFNTNKFSEYLFADENPYYDHSYGIGWNNATNVIRLAPDYRWNVFALEDKIDLDWVTLSSEAALSHVTFPGKAGLRNGTYAIDTGIVGFGSYLLAEMKIPVKSNELGIRARVNYVQPSFYCNAKDNASISGFLITPKTYRFQKVYYPTISEFDEIFGKDPEKVSSRRDSATSWYVNNMAEPDIHTIVPTIGDERMMVNTVSSSIKFLLPVPTGHAFVNWALFHEQHPSNNMIEFPYTLNGRNLYFAAQNSPFTILHYYNDYLLGYMGRGDTSAISPTRFSSQISRSKQLYSVKSAGMLTDYHLAAERFRYHRNDAVDTIRFTVGERDRGNADTLEGTPSRKQVRKLGFDFGFDLADYFSILKKTMLLECVVEMRSVFETSTAAGKYGLIPTLNDENILNGQFASLTLVQEITPTFCLVGMAGFEKWQSRHAWIWYQESDENYYWLRTPIDYTDYLFGIGFDWNLTSRTGIHIRFEKYGHIDENLVDINKNEPNTYNNLQSIVEMKTFF